MKASFYFYFRAVVFAVIMAAILAVCAPPMAQAQEGNIDKVIASLQLAQQKGASTVEVALLASVRDHSVVKVRQVFAVVQSAEDKTVAAVLVLAPEEEGARVAQIRPFIEALQKMKNAGVQHVVASVLIGVKNGEPVTEEHEIYNITRNRDGNAVLIVFEGVKV